MANMIPISTVTVGSGGASSIDFINIPQTYTDLVIKTSARSNSNAGGTYTELGVSFNGSTASFTGRRLYGTGAAAASDTSAPLAGISNSNTATASTFSNGEIYIPNYTSANNKSVSTDSVQETNATTAIAMLTAILWSNTSPINQVTLTLGVGNFVQYSTATLYGIRKY